MSEKDHQAVKALLEQVKGDNQFDLGAAKNELKSLRGRARRLERDIEAALAARLRAMGTQLYMCSDLSSLLADVRRFVDERPEK